MAKKTKRSLKNFARLKEQRKSELEAEQCRRDQQKQMSEKDRFQQTKSAEVETQPCSRGECEPERSDISLKQNVSNFIAIGVFLYNEFKRKLGEQLESFRQKVFTELSINALFEPNVKDFLAMGANLCERGFKQKLGEQSESFRRKVFAELWKQKAFRQMVEREKEKAKLLKEQYEKCDDYDDQPLWKKQQDIYVYWIIQKLQTKGEIRDSKTSENKFKFRYPKPIINWDPYGCHCLYYWNRKFRLTRIAGKGQAEDPTGGNYTPGIAFEDVDELIHYLKVNYYLH